MAINEDDRAEKHIPMQHQSDYPKEGFISRSGPFNPAGMYFHRREHHPPELFFNGGGRVFKPGDLVELKKQDGTVYTFVVNQQGQMVSPETLLEEKVEPINPTLADLQVAEWDRRMLAAVCSVFALPVEVITDPRMPPGQAIVKQDGKEVGRIINIGEGEPKE